MPSAPRVCLVTLGCGRNEVDSEELAARLEQDGWSVAAEPSGADVVVVNTCGFVDAAKKDSIDTLLAAADTPGAAVVAVGCLAERYGSQLAEALPEAAVLGFDDYPAIGARLRAVLAGGRPAAHAPRDRRTLLPLTPVERPAAAGAVPGHGPAPAPPAGAAPAGTDAPTAPRALRRRLADSPVAPLKIASGCDRRCAFCAIPSFRGAFVSRRPDDVLAEAAWLVGQGVREVVLVSENSTSYGKDLGDLRALEALLPRLAAVDGLARVRVSYLQPAETRPGLLDVVCGTPGVASYLDLPFQHASTRVLRTMNRFGGAQAFLDILAAARARDPGVGVRSNVIVGFPGETDADVDELVAFLGAARLDAVGVFGYSDEEGTAAADLPGKLPDHEIRARVEHVVSAAEELAAQRAEDRVGERVDVLVERVAGGRAEGRAAAQGPDDGATVLEGAPAARVGDVVAAEVVGTDGVDLRARALRPAAARGGGAGRPAQGGRAGWGSGSP